MCDLHTVELVFCWGLTKATSKHKHDLYHPESIIELPSRSSKCMVTMALAIGCMAASRWPASHIAVFITISPKARANWQSHRQNTHFCSKMGKIASKRLKFFCLRQKAVTHELKASKVSGHFYK